MRDFVGEMALYAAICVLGVAGLWVWRMYPAAAVPLVIGLAVLVGWAGYRIEKNLRPEGSLSRRVVAAAFTVGFVGFAVFVVWVSLCSCT
jgi:hypothetical protein